MDSRKKIIDFIEEVCEIRQITVSRLATEAGVSPSTLNKFLSNPDSPYPALRTLDKVAQAASFSSYEDFIISKFINEIQKVEIIGYVGKNARVYIESSNNKVESPIYTDNKMLVAVRVNGGVMEPVYQDGDALYYRNDKKYDSAGLDRQCIVQIREGPICIGIVKKGGEHFFFDIVAHDNNCLRDVNIEWMSRILWVKKA